MPDRRPSASAGHSNSAHSSNRAHRSNDSHHALSAGNGLPHPNPMAYQVASSTPHQQIVQSLITRIKNKLPVISGLALDIVEAEPATQSAIEALAECAHESLDIIAWSLSKLLERFAEQINADGQVTTEILQSQLFVLKILSLCMSSTWNHRQEHVRSNSRTSQRHLLFGLTQGNVEPSLPSTSTLHGKKMRQTSSEELLSSAPPLDDNCARYVLSVMVLYLRQTVPPESRLMSSSNLAPDASLHDFESVDLPTTSAAFDEYSGVDGPPLPPHISDAPKPVLKFKHSATSFQSGASVSSSQWQFPRSPQFEKTHMALVKSTLALNIFISKFAGRIVYHLSSTNWGAVFQRIRTKIRFLADTTEDDPDTVDLQLMMHSAMDRTRVFQVLNELSSLLVNMKKQAQAAVAIPLRMALWNWVEMYPHEYNEAIRSRSRLEGAPERVFNLLHVANEPGRERALWPTLTILACLWVDRLTMDYQLDVHSRSMNVIQMPKSASHRKDSRFVEELIRHANSSSKLADVALVCAIDMCRAGFRISPDGELPLRHIAMDIALEIKSAILCTHKQKPFWDSFDDIDVATYAEALVTVFRFLPEEQSIPLFLSCLEPERSDAVKICAIKAATTLSLEAARLPWQPSLDDLQMAIAPRLRDLYKTSSCRRSEVDEDDNIRRAALRPKARRFTSETLVDKDLMLLAILTLWRTTPDFYILRLHPEEIQDWISTSGHIWDSDADIAVKIAAASSFQHITDIFFRMKPDDHYYPVVETWMRFALGNTLLCISKKLLSTRLDTQSQRLWVSVAHRIIETYHRKSEGNHAASLQLSQDRVSAFAMSEIAFIVSLTSANSDVSRLAAQGLRLVAEAERHPHAPVNPGLTEEEWSKRSPIYEQLGDPSVVIVGRVQEQKRFRKLLRLVAYPSPINIAVWEECFWRWTALSEFVVPNPLAAIAAFDEFHLSKQEKSLSLEEKFIQWRHLTLFMAAFGGATVQEQHSESALTTVIPARYLPDQMRALHDPAELVNIFIESLTAALIDDAVRVRDVAREALGSELSPRLFAKLFKHFHEIVRNITEGAGPVFKDEYGFLDQLMSLLKSLVENAQIPPDEALYIDLGSILYLLAGLISRVSDATSYRIRIKFCILCDSICERTDTLTLRKDDLSRNRILDVVMEWFQELSLDKDAELVQLQRDLNMASLRTVVSLLDRLKLQPIDGTVPHHGDDSVHAISRLFIRYSQALLRTLEICQSDSVTSDSTSDVPSLQKKMHIPQKEADLRDLVITGLSNLVIANSEYGVKHCISSAYDQDVRKRTIFVHVFARVLGKGAKFEPQSNPEVQARRNQLRELVKGSDMSLAMVMCECCPPNEVDMMISVLMNIFDTRSSLMALLKTMIDREIARTTSDTDLFRSNSTCARFLSAFAKIHGYNYLRSLILPLIKTMASMPPGHAYDLDPVRASSDKLEQNRKDVEFIASSFLEIISASVPAFPPMFREICAHLAKTVYQVWPESKFAALGAFIFLRFISPAIVSPESVDIEIPNDDAVIRRGLMIIAKVMQNLANNIFFAKEAHMTCLNEFLAANIANVTRYLSEVNKYSATAADEETGEWLGTTADDTDNIVLHRFLDKHTDKIGKELLSYVKPANEDDGSTIDAKRAWDQLCNVLVELQEAPAVPRLSQLHSSEHQEFIDLMNRCAHRDTGAVRDIFVVASDVPQDAPAVFVLRVRRIDAEALDIELLMYYILKTLCSGGYENRMFEIILDCTCFTSTSEISVQWLKTCSQLLPVDVRQRFLGGYILNANALTQRYLRRMYNISAGTILSSGMRTCSSVAELLQHVPQSCLGALEYPTSLEKENHTEFPDVTMRQHHDVRMPVNMEVALTHIRITSIRAALISPSLSCKTTEIIPLADISDAYNVSTGLDPHEFIIRLSKQGVTSYFSSPHRETIVKSIRTAKSQLRDTHSFSTERFSRFSNISATLLHVGMLNIDSEEEELRNAAYDLLGAICTYLNYDKSPLIASKVRIIPGDISTFVIGLSERLANFAPKLTLDFLSVISVGMDKSSAAQRITCLQYMSPWVRNLSLFCTPSSPLYEHSGARLRDCVRSLIDLSVADLEISSIVHRYIWMEIGKLDTTIVNVVLDELVRAAADSGIGSRRCETIARMTAALASINVRGKIFSKLRKVLTKTSLKPPRTLPESSHWNEIATLTRFAFVASNHSKQVTFDQLYVPDICHIVTLVAGVGQTLVRKSVYGVIMNFLQSFLLARADDVTGPDVRALVDELVTAENLKLFGLTRQSGTSEYSDHDPPNDKATIETQEGLTRLLARIMEVTAGSNGLLNVWRARWMSLATSTAFQLPAVIQARAFLVLGTLATSDVDDDLVYQMLIAFKTALGQSTETDTMTVVCMLRCICKTVPSFPQGSRYLCQVFWLAVALLQSSYAAFYADAAELLRAVIDTLQTQGMFHDSTIANVLLEGRTQLEDTICQLDHLLCLSFESSFSFTLAAIIFKGVRHNQLKSSAEAVLRSLLSVAVHCNQTAGDDSSRVLPLDALGYFISLIPFSTTRESYTRLLQGCNAEEFLPATCSLNDNDFVPRVAIDMLPITDITTALLVVSFAMTVLTTAQGDDVETEMLYNLLLDVSIPYPELSFMIYETLQDRIKETFTISSNPAIIRTLSNIFRISQEPLRMSLRGGSTSTLGTMDEDSQVLQELRRRLEDLGMNGLTNSLQFLPPNRSQWARIAAWISELVLKMVG